MKRGLQKIRSYIVRRPLLVPLLTMGWNIVYAIINLVFCLLYSSYWYLTLFALHLMLGLMKLSAVTVAKSRRRTEAGMMKHNGFAMIFLFVILAGLMVLTITEVHNPTQNLIIIIIHALFCFTFAGISIRNILRAYRTKSAALIALRNISCASAIVSMISLERSMLGTFGDGSDRFTVLMEAWSGGAAFLLLVCLGISMIVYAAGRKNSLERH